MGTHWSHLFRELLLCKWLGSHPIVRAQVRTNTEAKAQITHVTVNPQAINAHHSASHEQRILRPPCLMVVFPTLLLGLRVNVTLSHSTWKHRDTHSRTSGKPL